MHRHVYFIHVAFSHRHELISKGNNMNRFRLFKRKRWEEKEEKKTLESKMFEKESRTDVYNKRWYFPFFLIFKAFLQLYSTLKLVFLHLFCWFCSLLSRLIFWAVFLSLFAAHCYIAKLLDYLHCTPSFDCVCRQWRAVLSEWVCLAKCGSNP